MDHLQNVMGYFDQHSDMTKSHDEPFTNAVLSWLYLLPVP